MFKNVSLVLCSLVVLASAAVADDDLLTELANSKGADIVDSAIEIEDLNDLDLDVDQLAADATGGEDGEVDAIEACFRRFGYRSWGYSCYRSYYNCYRPYYGCYNYYSRPIYNYCRPYVNYWGCY